MNNEQAMHGKLFTGNNITGYNPDKYLTITIIIKQKIFFKNNCLKRSGRGYI
ncbi:hypothetical protein JCM11672_06900 [Alkaliphilus crotonatoxidans]